MAKYEEILQMWKERVHSEAELDAIMSMQGINMAYHSGKMENDEITYHDTREIFDRDGVTSYTGSLRTLFEIQNAKKAQAFFLRAYGENMPFNEDFIRQLQKILTEGTYDEKRYINGERPGNYKIHDYVTGREEVGALPEDVEEEMQELMEEFANISGTKILTAAAYFHAKFENIHPFADGNGRTGRLAMNYLLVMHGHPAIVIHEEDRGQYYQALEAWDTEQNLEPLKDFLIYETEKTWDKQVQRHQKQHKGRKGNQL